MYEIGLWSDLRYIQMFPNDTSQKFHLNENGNKILIKDRDVKFDYGCRFGEVQTITVPFWNCNSRYGDYKTVLRYFWYAKKFLTLHKIDYKFRNDSIKRIKLTTKGRVYACYL